MPTIELLPKRSKRADRYKKDAQKVYQSSRYKKVRQYKRETNPVCEVCELMGKTTAGTQVHHWISFQNKLPEERDRLAYDYDNLVMLCDHCHEEMHGGKFTGCRNLEDVKKILKLMNLI